MPDEASAQLGLIRGCGNLYEQYLVATLRLHVAALKEDKDQVASILSELQDVRYRQPLIDGVATAIERGDLELATQYEVALLLRAA
jgi:hypothetical protein